MFKFSKKSIERRKGIDPRLIAISDRALEISKVDFGIPKLGGLRTAEEQKRLCDQYKSNADGVIKKSKHQTGDALDVYAYVKGAANWDMVNMAQIAAAMLQAANELGHKIQWGGLWKSFKDLPHFEIK